VKKKEREIYIYISIYLVHFFFAFLSFFFLALLILGDILSYRFFFVLITTRTTATKYENEKKE